MPRVGFEATIPLLERATSHGLDHEATVIGRFQLSNCLFVCLIVFHPFQAQTSE
jgi:hypothetical protein